MKLDFNIFGLTQSKKRIYVATWRDGKNFGDDYLSIALTGYLRKKFNNFKIIATNYHLDNYKITENDILIIGGGGVHDGRFLPMLYSAWINAPSKLIIANVGLEFMDPSYEYQLSNLCKKAELFSLRDQPSSLIVRKILGECKAFWAADTTYLNPIQVTRKPVKSVIGVNLCGPEQEDYRRNYPIDKIVTGISGYSKLGYTLKSMPFTYKGPLSDYKYCKKIDPTCPKHFSIAPYRNCELFIGMHFHSVVLALQNCVPTIAINYSEKVKRIMQEYGLDNYCLEPEDPELMEKMLFLIRKIDKAEVVGRIKQGNEMARKRLIPFEEKLQSIIEG